MLYTLGRQADAVLPFLKAAELDPEFEEAWNNLGNALVATDRAEGALFAYRRAIQLEPGYADAHFNLAETLAAAGNLAEACTHWERFLDLEPAAEGADDVRERLKRARSLTGAQD